jgi:hypothetical protein
MEITEAMIDAVTVIIKTKWSDCLFEDNLRCTSYLYRTEGKCYCRESAIEMLEAAKAAEEK